MAEQGFTLTERDLRRIAGMLREFELGERNTSVLRPPRSRAISSQRNKPRFNLARNIGPTEVPAFGIVEIDSTESDEEGIQRFLVKQKADGGSEVYLINGLDPIADQSTGAPLGGVSCDWPVEALYDSADTPAVGEEWGPTDGSYLLKKSGSGFQIVGSPKADPDGGRERVRVKASAATSGFAKTKSGGIAAATESPDDLGSATCDLYVADDAGLLTDTGVDDTIWNIAGAVAGTTFIAWTLIDGKKTVVVERCA